MLAIVGAELLVLSFNVLCICWACRGGARRTANWVPEAIGSFLILYVMGRVVLERRYCSDLLDHHGLRIATGVGGALALILAASCSSTGRASWADIGATDLLPLIGPIILMTASFIVVARSIFIAKLEFGLFRRSRLCAGFDHHGVR